MKKILIALILIAAAAAGWFFFIKPKAEKPAARGELVEPRAGTVRPSTGSGRTETPPAQPETPPQAPSAPKEQPPKTAPAPIRIRFDSQIPLEKDKAVPVTLVVESVPEGWPAEVGEGARLELLLRLPAGVKLKSEGWAPAELPKEDREDASGPWSLYEKKLPLQLKLGVPPETLLKETVDLAVVEEGTNWIITARARLTQGTSSWQTFGALFATLQGKSGQFHAVPKAPTDIRSAQAS